MDLRISKINDDKPKWLEGAARLYRDEGCHSIAEIEWNLKTDFLHAALSLRNGDGPEVCLSLGAGVFVHFSAAIPQKLLDVAREHLLKGVEHSSYEGVRVLEVSRLDDSEWTIVWSIAHPDMSWHSTTPKWRHGSLCFADALLGKVESIEETRSGHGVKVPLPEGVYWWDISLIRTVHTRKRWPLPRVTYTYVAKPRDGEHIPFPGKGENSWDCGADALYGSSGPARTVDEAITDIVGSVLSYRQRYGGNRSLGYVEGGKYDTASTPESDSKPPSPPAPCQDASAGRPPLESPLGGSPSLGQRLNEVVAQDIERSAERLNCSECGMHVEDGVTCLECGATYDPVTGELRAGALTRTPIA
jgi:hypothetical protein